MNVHSTDTQRAGQQQVTTRQDAPRGHHGLLWPLARHAGVCLGSHKLKSDGLGNEKPLVGLEPPESLPASPSSSSSAAAKRPGSRLAFQSAITATGKSQLKERVMPSISNCRSLVTWRGGELLSGTVGRRAAP